jgi:hypothetical protein
MYDREVDVPRLLGYFRLEPPPDATPTAVVDAARRVVAHLGVPFKASGSTCTVTAAIVAPHNDHLYDMAKGFRSLFFHWARRGA